MTGVLTGAERRVPVRALLGYLPQLARWPALAAGVVVAWLLTWWRAEDVIDAVGAVWVCRLALAVGCAAAVFALDDPSRNVTEPLVGTRRRAMPARLAVAAVVLPVAAVPAAVVVREHLSASLVAGLAAEGFATLALLCALSLSMQRVWGIAEPAQYLPLTLLLVGVVEQLTAGRWPLLAGPGPQWDDAHWRWAVVALVASGAAAWQLRDPASRTRIGVASRRGHTTQTRS